jgi:hypothetical protein
MDVMTINIVGARDAPSKIGEFFPSTGQMADGRDNLWLSGNEVVATIIRDLALYRNDFREIVSGIDYKEFPEMYKELGEMIKTYAEYFKTLTGRPITPQDIEGLSTRPPMNPVEEAVGFMTRMDTWLSCPGYESQYSDMGFRSHYYSLRLDRINDRLWILIDTYERRRN